MVSRLITSCLMVLTAGVVAGCATPPPPAPPANEAKLSVGPGFPPPEAYLGPTKRADAVKLCMDSNGQLTQPATLVRPTGNPSYDAALVRYANATSGHWIPKLNGVRVATCAVVPLPPPQLPLPSLHNEVKVSWSMGAGFPSLAGFYPATSRRLGEQGTAVVRICAGANGELTRPPGIIRSSGSPRLDAAAISFANATSGRWVLRRLNGGPPPATACVPLPVQFSLK